MPHWRLHNFVINIGINEKILFIFSDMEIHTCVFGCLIQIFRTKLYVIPISILHRFMRTYSLIYGNILYSMCYEF